MGLTAELRDAGGDLVRGLVDPAGGTFDRAGDFERLLPFDDQSFRLLCYLNPYGDTMFNTVQMADLLTEVDQLAGRDPKPIERRGLDRLRVLAERCRDDPHLYVWFIGD